MTEKNNIELLAKYSNYTDEELLDELLNLRDGDLWDGMSSKANSRLYDEVDKVMRLRLSSHATELDRVREVGQKLADWSRKYPRSRIYGYGSQPKMDGELIELENEAKLLFPELTNQLTQEDKDESK